MSLSHKIAGKTILIVGGGLLQVPIIQTARMMKLTTVVADMNADAPGMKICDIPMVMSTKDIEGMVRESKKARDDNQDRRSDHSGNRREYDCGCGCKCP
ncbi:hypothetical protein LEP1GSC043_3780 [Leptospira weilii str. Ecochallenge]|uniref:Uncharacterized protein n=1 Tax=Leptospira weilii str. Ecochallenge TaxID=1049986 RepID=N1U6H8_9LEPT|nr:hypothetical protein LEP1GSC043_3780 [Leptospira weilii str. Ecochallenge]